MMLRWVCQSVFKKVGKAFQNSSDRNRELLQALLGGGRVGWPGRPTQVRRSANMGTLAGSLPARNAF